MDREIKFRAWDKERLMMYNADNIYAGSLISDCLLVNVFAIADEETGDRNKQAIRFKDRYIFQQYTGLKDKNGQEIYEGDIVRHPEYCNSRLDGEYISQIVWSTTGDSDGYYYGGHVTWVTKEHHNSLFDVHEESEVIGNIHETPELI